MNFPLLAHSKALPLLLVTIAIAGCASVPLQVTPQQRPNQIITYDHGVALVSLLKTNGQKGGVVVWHAGGFRAALLGINFHNLTKSTCDFGLENISATDGNGRPLHIYTPQELRKIAVGQYNAMAMTAAIAGASQAVSASMPSTASYSGTVYSGGAYGGYSGTATGYNPAQAAIANQAIQANTVNAVNNAGASLDDKMSLVSQMLDRTTVPPDRYVQGFIDIQKAPVINLKVNANGEEMTATFNVQ